MRYECLRLQGQRPADVVVKVGGDLLTHTRHGRESAIGLYTKLLDVIQVRLGLYYAVSLHTTISPAAPLQD